ncbi:MAG: hypothetical protein JEY91_01875 [Spirochaetaceae bacterium]|nr:hypothetical protein [Spirochaetaceae bacterium]
MKILIMSLLLLTPLMSLFSQSNEELDRFLNQPTADLASAVWLVYLSSGTLPYEATPEEAMDYLMESDNRSRFAGKSGDTPITYREFALIAMDEHDLPGGLMYRIFRSPRYAAKEMTYRRWMPGKPKGGTELTPWDVTTSLSQILSWKEEQ